MAGETTPTAPAEAPKAPESVENPTNTNEPAPSETPFLDKMDKKDLASIDKFLANNGGIEAFNKWKQDVSNPKPKVEEKPAESKPEVSADVQSTQPQPTPQPQTPQGAITQAEFLAQQYFKALSTEEKYASIAKGIQNGDYLKEMSMFGINALNPDGSINDQKVRMYLDLKAQTVPAQPTNVEPNASTAPTVNYVEVGDKIETMEQAQAVFMQAGHPKRELAKEFIKAQINKKMD